MWFHLILAVQHILAHRREKVNVKYNDENGTVTYQQKKTWKFLDEDSNGRLDDVIVNINVIALVKTLAQFLSLNFWNDFCWFSNFLWINL